MNSSYPAWVRRHRRTLGIPVVIAALILARFDSRFLLVSIILVSIGEALRIWAAGHLRKDAELATSGPYRFIRNPLYLGSFLIATGFCFIAGSMWVTIIVVLYFALCYFPVVRWEEELLRSKFGHLYDRFASSVPAFYPTFRPAALSSARNFSWKQMMRNKEYNAVLGILLGYLYLVVRSKYF